MKEYKTIGYVLRKGQIYVNVSVTLIMIVIWLLTVYLSYRVVPERYSTETMFIGLVSGFISGWLFWSLSIPKWRIWAFQNTKKTDWPELQIRAINEKLILKKDSIFNKTEIRTKIQNKKIQKIEEEIPNIRIETTLINIEDDITIPSKTHYYYAKSELILNPILLIVFILLGIYLISKQREVIGIIGILFGIYVFKVKLFKDLLNPQIQMTISNDGISMNLKDMDFVKWSDTENIVLNSEGALTLDVWKNDELFYVTYDVGSFGMKNREDMIRKINIYLKRNQKNTEANT